MQNNQNESFITKHILPGLDSMSNEYPRLTILHKRESCTGAENEFPDFNITIRCLSDKVNYRCFEIVGNSMDNDDRSSLLDKDVVIGKRINLDVWKHSACINNWSYAIIQPNGSTIKRITGFDSVTGKVNCHSLNSAFEDFEIDIKDIGEMYIIVKIISRSMKLNREQKNLFKL